MKKLLLLFAAVGIMASASAQDYRFGIGMRFGTVSGIDFKWNVSQQNAWQFNLDFPLFRGMEVFAAYEWGWTLSTMSDGTQFRAFAGPAAATGIYDWRKNRDTGFLFGFGGIGGFEFNFTFPLSLSLDYRPMFTFHSGSKTHFDPWGFYNFGLTARFCF